MEQGSGPTQNKGNNGKKGHVFINICRKCGARRIDKQIGLEEVHDCLAWARQEPPCATCYVCTLREVFRALWRVLRDDGVCFLNLGDSYSGSGKGGNPDGSPYAGFMGNKDRERAAKTGKTSIPYGLKPKDLIGIPWRVALALQADGWFLRRDIIWDKGNPMPESVQGSHFYRHQIPVENSDERVDCPGCPKCAPHNGYISYRGAGRPTSSHEYVFILSKLPSYYFDSVAIAEPTVSNHSSGNGFRRPQHISRDSRGSDEQWTPTLTRNARSVWHINTQPFAGSHFAVMPEKLVERCLLAGSSPQACEHCGAPWARVVEREPSNWQVRKAAGAGRGSIVNGHTPSHGIGVDHTLGGREAVTTGWQPTCSCPNEGTGTCVILDPFAGSGTVGQVAITHHRSAVLIDLNPSYTELQIQRTNGVQTSMTSLFSFAVDR